MASTARKVDASPGPITDTCHITAAATTKIAGTSSAANPMTRSRITDDKGSMMVLPEYLARLTTLVTSFPTLKGRKLARKFEMKCTRNITQAGMSFSLAFRRSTHRHPCSTRSRSSNRRTSSKSLRSTASISARVASRSTKAKSTPMSARLMAYRRMVNSRCCAGPRPARPALEDGCNSSGTLLSAMCHTAPYARSVIR